MCCPYIVLSIKCLILLLPLTPNSRFCQQWQHTMVNHLQHSKTSIIRLRWNNREVPDISLSSIIHWSFPWSFYCWCLKGLTVTAVQFILCHFTIDLLPLLAIQLNVFNLEITFEWHKSMSTLWRKNCLSRVHNLIKTTNNRDQLLKTVRLNSFQKMQSQSIFNNLLQFSHPCLLLCLLF